MSLCVLIAVAVLGVSSSDLELLRAGHLQPGVGGAEGRLGCGGGGSGEMMIVGGK